MTLLRELIAIPEAVHQGDFVLSLADGVSRPAQTLGTYVVTEQLRTAFDAGLSLVQTALASRSSKGALFTGASAAGRAISWPCCTSS